MAAAFPDSVAAFEGRVETGDGVEVAHALKMRLRRAKRERVVPTEGNLIATRWSLTATHDGPLGDIEPTGNKVNISGQLIMRFEGPRVAEEWESFDEVAMLKQIGVMPE